MSDAPSGELSDADLRALYAPPGGPWLRANMITTVGGAGTSAEGLSGSISNRPTNGASGCCASLPTSYSWGAGTARAETYHPADRRLVVVIRRAQVPPSLQSADPGAVLLGTNARRRKACTPRSGS